MNCSWKRNQTAFLSLVVIFVMMSTARGQAGNGTPVRGDALQKIVDDAARASLESSNGRLARDVPADNDAVDIMLLGDSGPIFVRWRLRRDGKSFRAVWHDFADAMFQRLDVDRDGLIDAFEAAVAK
jgi:hypothetical protein